MRMVANSAELRLGFSWAGKGTDCEPIWESRQPRVSKVTLDWGSAKASCVSAETAWI